jgi:hypothetical protein
MENSKFETQPPPKDEAMKTVVGHKKPLDIDAIKTAVQVLL